MPHYKDGTEVKVGDAVIGRGYNVKHLIQGVVVDVRPGQSSCNLSVMHTLPYNGYGTWATGGPVPMQAIEHGQADAFERADLHEKRLEELLSREAASAKRDELVGEVQETLFDPHGERA